MTKDAHAEQPKGVSGPTPLLFRKAAPKGAPRPSVGLLVQKKETQEASLAKVGPPIRLVEVSHMAVPFHNIKLGPLFLTTNMNRRVAFATTSEQVGLVVCRRSL